MDSHDGTCVCHNPSHAAGLVVQDIAEVWPEGSFFVSTLWLVKALSDYAPERWSEESCYGRDLTPQRLGRLLAREAGIFSSKNHLDQRGYCHHDFRASAEA